MSSALVGKFILISTEDYYQSGKIMASINDSHVLIKLRPVSPEAPPNQRIYDITALDCNCGQCRNAFFFDTEADLDNWLKWVEDTPDDDTPKSRVININDKKKH